MKTQIGLALLLCGLFSAFGSSQASYSLGVQDSSNNLGPGPYVNVTLDLIAGQIQFTLDAISPYVVVDQFDFNGVAATLVPTAGYTQVSPGQVDGFGTFVQGISKDGGNGASNPFPDPFVFTVSKTGGGSFAGVEDLIADSSGNSPAGAQFFAAHVAQIVGGCVASSTCATGFVTTPEPGFYGALSLGLAGLCIAIGRHRRSAA